MQDIQQRLGERIRRLRLKKGWSQEHFADVCGLHRTYVGAVERGEKNLTLSNLQILANTLQVRIADLFRGVG